MYIMTASSDPSAAPTLSIILPSYNENQSVRTVLKAVRMAVEDIAPDYEIIVINDGSTDTTAGVVEQVQMRNPRIRCITHSSRQGYGAAVRSGIAAARGEYIFLTDTDGQFDLTEFPTLYTQRDEFDLVIGYRTQRADPTLRMLYARGWRWLMSWLLGVDVRDPNCAFKLMRRDIVQRLDLRSTGALFSAELLALALRAGATLTEVPISHRPREHGTPTGGNPFVILRAFRELLRHRRRITHGDPYRTDD